MCKLETDRERERERTHNLPAEDSRRLGESLGVEPPRTLSGGVERLVQDLAKGDPSSLLEEVGILTGVPPRTGRFPADDILPLLTDR